MVSVPVAASATTVLERATGESMYHPYKGLLYPAKTFLCLLGELMFYRRLKNEIQPVGEDDGGAKT